MHSGRTLTLLGALGLIIGALLALISGFVTVPVPPQS